MLNSFEMTIFILEFAWTLKLKIKNQMKTEILTTVIKPNKTIQNIKQNLTYK